MDVAGLPDVHEHRHAGGRQLEREGLRLAQFRPGARGAGVGRLRVMRGELTEIKRQVAHPPLLAPVAYQSIEYSVIVHGARRV
ncbi:hypothetical protein AW736_00185 [Termitidicoccus mucosus]|uniref:Uncharacterized protein n=1 Tax=Termitidicoccus mucosus TaxID=1184151 RepID=A0A178ILY2_9BACT|nr:hypothetical protein AW736_00185 [Opitutaceae bacterium TSB47]